MIPTSSNQVTVQVPSITRENTYKKYIDSPNINKVPKIKYIPIFSTAPNPKKEIINNINTQACKNIRGIKVPTRNMNNTNTSHPMKNLCT